jgi:hypothetical protein
MPTLIVLNLEPPSKEDAQRFVGGPFAIIQLDTGDQMLVHEEGLLFNLPYNTYASRLARQTIVGSAMILSGDAKWSPDED